MARAVLAATEAERVWRARAERDADIAGIAAERLRLEGVFARRAEELARKEREVDRRERERLLALEERAALMSSEERKRQLWFRVRRGCVLKAQRRRIQARVLVPGGGGGRLHSN